ncbi:SDR family oxidoreductase [Blastopirellula sp. JC732]|uniref:SDR family oxidoreductase n=1 Tax=Blastopirellula sediminis TaxID=2894196 RepID=A0A9X1MJ63_9BACT|nr:SDR family oxidoreductase [Blastopirellula sediminis]MCC9608042.1 SDR family oxidoreductase [Blastopirellula sediminis]MCC9627165.1 SDR family oxidoreductase [Blastopirellula sediminis]
MRLLDKVVIITGGCTGIGKRIAQRAVAEGASVVINGLQQELGDKLLAELGQDRAALHIENITQEGCPDRLVALAISKFGKLDGVVNNAALIAPGDISTTSADFFRMMLEVNTLAPFRLIQAALPQLKATQGSVLNIGSVNAYCGEPNLLPYSVSKGALMTMTRNLGDALLRTDGVRVNQINPGWTLTEAEQERKEAEGLGDDWSAGLPNLLAPTGRILWPEEIAAAAVYWLSDESRAISGQVLDLEQYPIIGRNPPKDRISIPAAR